MIIIMVFKFQILSDFHLEFYKKTFPLIKPLADNLFLPGDIGYIGSENWIAFMQYASEKWKNVFYITGNHEYYKGKPKEELDIECEKLLKSYQNIHFMNNKKLVHNGIEIIGCNLWSSPSSFENLSDFHLIKSNANDVIPMHEWNQNDISFLQDELKTPAKRIVMTHFMPLQNKDIPNSIYPCGEYDSYFGNYLYDLFPKTNIWISGHTHQSFDFNIDNTRWICNSYGYPNEKYTNYKDDVFQMET